MTYINLSGGKSVPPSLPVSAAEFKRRMVLMRRWFAEFSDEQRTAATAHIEASFEGSVSFSLAQLMHSCSLLY